MTTYLGGEYVAGGKLKEIGTSHWVDNISSTNESGFTALPGGYRPTVGQFSSRVSLGYYWGSTASDASKAWYRVLFYNHGYLTRADAYKSEGYSVRCVKD